jgi:DNA-binding MarR family transcriptional regulator
MVGLTARFSNPVTPGQRVAGPENDADSEQIFTPGARKRVQDQRRLDPGQILSLVTGYLEGRSVSQLAREWRIHRTTVVDHLERNDVPRRTHVRNMTDEQVRVAAELYEARNSLAALDKRYDVDPKTVSKELKAAGVAIRPAGRWR